MSNVLYDVLTFAEATEIWHLADSTLRKLAVTDRLVKGEDFRKSGNTWIITKAAMLKTYGDPPTS